MKAVFKSCLPATAALLATAVFSSSAFAGAGPPPYCPSVPEIDPGSAAGALTLLVGGLMTLVDRRRAR